MMKIDYGSTEKTKILDENGSTLTTEKTYRAGAINPPVRMRYKIKIQVRNKKEEHEEYLKFSQEQDVDKSILDPAVELEHTKYGDANGFYYFIKCYTRLEYDTDLARNC